MGEAFLCVDRGIFGMAAFCAAGARRVAGLFIDIDRTERGRTLQCPDALFIAGKSGIIAVFDPGEHAVTVMDRAAVFGRGMVWRRTGYCYEPAACCGTMLDRGPGELLLGRVIFAFLSLADCRRL